MIHPLLSLLASATRQELARRRPDKWSYQRRQIVAIRSIATILERRGAFEPAEEMFRDALKRQQARVDSDKATFEDRLELADLHYRLGRVYYEDDRDDQADEQFETALQIQRQLVKEDPKDWGPAHDVAETLEYRAITADGMDRFDLAEAYFTDHRE